jgi:hypothetical protein
LKLSDSQKQNLAMRAKRYHDQLVNVDTGQAGRSYLDSRGLGTLEIARKYALGYVADPAPGDELFRGMLVLPYLTRDGVRAIKYRCLADHDCKEVPQHSKYNQPPGQEQRLYNALAYFSGTDMLGWCEGEIDAITASECLGVSTIGIPSASLWKKNGLYWQLITRDFGVNVIFGDGDPPGMAMAKEIANDAGQSARLVICDDKQDVNSMVLAGKASVLKRKAGLNND